MSDSQPDLRYTLLKSQQKPKTPNNNASRGTSAPKISVKSGSSDEIIPANSFLQTVSQMQKILTDLVRNIGLPTFSPHRWYGSDAAGSGPKPANLAGAQLLTNPFQQSYKSEGDDEVPEWARKFNLVTTGPHPIQAAFDEMKGVFEKIPTETRKELDRMNRSYLRRFGSNTQTNLLKTLDLITEISDRRRESNTAQSLDSGVPRYEDRKYNEPPLKLQICIKCNTSHNILECHWVDSDPTSLAVTSWTYVRNGLSGHQPILKLPTRVQTTYHTKGDAAICENCKRIPFEELFPPGDDRFLIAADLGRVCSVFFRQDCPTCVLLVNSIPSIIESKDTYVVLCSQLNLRRQLGAVRREPAMPSRILGIGIVNQPDEEGSCNTWKAANLGRLEDAPEAIALLQDESDDDKPTYFGGRLVSPASFEFELIHTWIDRCTRQHKGTCTPLKPPQLRDIRLIDVYQRKLVMYPQDTECDYLALSYVWGGCDPGPFSRHSKIRPLPATLENAISFTRAVGKTYLWVDAICIDQEDPDDKTRQIALMDIIYSGAWLTLVALSGTSADSGLYQINRKQQLTCQIGSFNFASTFPTLSQQVSDSVWGSRAWTFQGLLSPRTLYSLSSLMRKFVSEPYSSLCHCLLFIIFIYYYINILYYCLNFQEIHHFICSLSCCIA